MPVPPSAVKGDLVVDFIYMCRGTRLLRLATSRGIEILGGEEILLEQGFAQFSLFTGRRPPVGVMRRAVIQGLLKSAPAGR